MTKTPARGRGPEPHFSGRRVITLWKERCCPCSSTVGIWGPFCPPGYVRRSEDRLCEPRSPRLDHRRNHPVRGVLATFAYWVSRAYDSSAMVKVRHRRVRFSTMSMSPKHSLPWAYAVRLPYYRGKKQYKTCYL